MQQLHTTTPYLGNIKEAIKFYGNRQWKNKLNCTNKVQIDFEQEPLKTQNKIMGSCSYLEIVMIKTFEYEWILLQIES